MSVFRIKAQKLTPDAFAPYGKVIEAPEDDSQTVAEDRYTFWPEVACVSCGSGALQLGISRLFSRPLRTCVMERQLSTQVMIVPMTGPILILCAKAGSLDPQETVPYRKAEAFVVRRDQGVVIDRGVWHWTPMPLGGDGDVLFCTEKKPVDNGVVKQSFPRGEALEILLSEEG